MKVLLLDNVDGLGKVGDVINVNDGYARNYLIPRSLAVVASESQIKMHNNVISKRREKAESEEKEIKAIIEKLVDAKILVTKKATKDGKLFGAVTKKDIIDQLSNLGVANIAPDIDLSGVEKKIGSYKVGLIFPYNLKTEIDLTVELHK